MQAVLDFDEPAVGAMARWSKSSLARQLSSLETLIGVAVALAGDVSLSRGERQVAATAEPTKDSGLLEAVIAAVRSGQDPLGNAYSAVRSAESRRAQGQTFTPTAVVEGMLAWVLRQPVSPVRVVDPGAGSGRFTLAALRAMPGARVIAIEMDSTVALLLRANLAAAGLASRVDVHVADFRTLELPLADGPTLFLGNPPYVRHHDISAAWKTWYVEKLGSLGHQGSQLAGLHLHFFAKTLELAAAGDIGCFVTAAEWLDTRYGTALRSMLTNGLAATDVFVSDPKVAMFGDALVSAAITCFAPGAAHTELRFARLGGEAELRSLAPGRSVTSMAASNEPRWSVFVNGAAARKRTGFTDLGEMFKVSRGVVTGLNRVWVQQPGSVDLPSRFLLPAITDAADITTARAASIDDEAALKRLVCLPRDMGELLASDCAAIERFLRWARQQGAHEGYIAKHRNPWWSVGCKAPAPIVMTYMGRRPPAFALNRVGAQIINVAHGLYPRQAISEERLRAFVTWLNANVAQTDGRVYAGGLTKFEPSEAMRIQVPQALLGDE